MSTPQTTGGPGAAGGGFPVSTLIGIVQEATDNAKTKLTSMRGDKDISITSMFEMQMNMNKLSQMSEMATATVQACNTAISSMARNVKG